MTAPVSAPVIATLNASAPPSQATAPPSDSDIHGNDFSRFLADQGPVTDAEAPSTSPANLIGRDADDTDSIDHDDSDAPDTQLAELALQIAMQVAELHATPYTTHAAARPDAADPRTANLGLLSVNNARTNPRLADLPHATPAATDRNETTAPRLSVALPSVAPLAVPTTPHPNSLRPASPHLGSHITPRSGRTTALTPEPAPTGRSALHNTDLTADRGNAANVFALPNASTTAHPDLASPSGQALAALRNQADTALPTLPLLDAVRHASAEAAPAPQPMLPTLAAPLASPQWGHELGLRLVTLSQHAEGERHSAELRLDPPELGPLRVTLTLNDGIAHAAFVSPHAHVRQSIEAAIEQLQTTLAQSGITLGETSVSDQSEQNPAATSAPVRQRVRTSSPEMRAGEASAPVLRSDALLDVYA